MKKRRYSLTELDWTLSGCNPWEWGGGGSLFPTAPLASEIGPIPARVPGSVQQALRDAGLIPDWNLGLNARACEWVENRHWSFRTMIPSQWFIEGSRQLLRARGLDYEGIVFLDGQEIGRFRGTHQEHEFVIPPGEPGTDRELILVFTCPPRWLGQFGRTSSITEWKARFNYFWDWTSRLVQLGIWDDLLLEAFNEGFTDFSCRTELSEDGRGLVYLSGQADASPEAVVQAVLKRGDEALAQASFPASDLARGQCLLEIPGVEPWWPSGMGKQSLYCLETALVRGGEVLDEDERTVGFVSLGWKHNPGARADADPWLCHANGKPFFLQGINWTPIRPNFADVTDDQYRALLASYKEMGVNILRVWGGGFLEKEAFYRLCDEMGLMVWQEFPLSSSNVDSCPPDDPQSIAELTEIARGYIVRRQYHVSLAVWCGGNELRAEKSGGRPIDLSHPLMERFCDLVKALDPGRRFVTSTPSGPSFGANAADYGKGVHWAVNGPWKARGRLEDDWQDYWNRDDALLRSETGAPGASSVDLIERYRGEEASYPCSLQNPLWRRHPWWVEWEQFTAEHDREAADLGEYVAWSQERQARALRHAASCCKKRFPACGGFFIWMGHDSFPCAANTSIIDFEGNWKPAAHAVAEVFKGTPSLSASVP